MGKMSKEKLRTEIEFVYDRLLKNLDTFEVMVPPACSVDAVYPQEDNIDWTASFWVGMLFLAYEYQPNDAIEHVILAQLKSFESRLKNNIELETHDIGFLYSLSAVAAYRVLKDEKYADIAVAAADRLMTRFNSKSKIIQAWGDLSDIEQQGRMIIDCNMNLPLLYFASEYTNDSKYYDAAYAHVKQAQKYIIRPDNTTFHTFYMDNETGEPKYGKTAQGFSDDSCWARGQAWAFYGFALSYKYTKDASFLESAKKTADYFLTKLPEDKIVYWDLLFTDGDEEKDSSSAAIAISGLIELAGFLPLSDPKKRIYEDAALEMLEMLSLNYTTKEHPTSNGILLHAVYAKPDNKGVDECCIWGDYFYLESLIRVYQTWDSYW